MLRRVKIFYDGHQGYFVYDSNVPDLYLAVAVATKEMFKQSIWLDPKETRIDEVHVEHVPTTPDTNEDVDGHYEGGEI